MKQTFPFLLRGIAAKQFHEKYPFLQKDDDGNVIIDPSDLPAATTFAKETRPQFVPVIPNIHQTLYEHVRTRQDLFDMGSWRSENDCGTSYCRGGWAFVLAATQSLECSKAVRALKDIYNQPMAAALIYFASDTRLERTPNWYAPNEMALADMRTLAAQEAERADAAE